MRLRLSDCVYNKPLATGDAKAVCVAEYVQSFEENLKLEESEEKGLPRLVRLLTSSKVLDSRRMQYGQARSHIATARAYIENGETDSAIDEILLARKISTSADEEYSGELRRSIDRGSGAAKVLLATGTSLVVIGTAGGAAAYVGGGAAAVYGTSTVGGLLATMGFSTLAGANGGLLAGAVLGGTRSLAMGTPYEYSVDEQIQYATFGGAVGLLQGSFPFAARTGIGWARNINPGAGVRGTAHAVAKKAVELTPVAITQSAISAAQVKISGGSNSEVAAGAAIGAAIPFVYSGMMLAFGLPANLKVLTWSDPRFPNEYARVIFYDGVERPYQVYDYRVTKGSGQPLADARVPTSITLPAGSEIVTTRGMTPNGTNSVGRHMARRVGMYEKNIGPEAEEMFDRKLRLQVDVSFERQLGFMRRNGLSDCGRVLDVGTGNGYFLCKVANNHPTTQFTGMDFKKDAIEKARRTAQELAAKNADWDILDVTSGSLPGRDSYFDGIVMRYADIHIPNIIRAMGFVTRMLRPGGRIWIFSVDLDLTFSRPFHPVYDLYRSATIRFYKTHGMDAHIAKKMPSILTSCGYSAIVSEPDPMSNRDMGPEMFGRFMVDQAVVFGSIDPTSFTPEETELIRNFAETDARSPDFYGTHGVVMISGIKL